MSMGHEAHALTAVQLRELERDLRSERARAERALVADVVGGASDVEVPIGAPRTATTPDDGVDLALETLASARHQALLDALARIEAGTYGSCLSCGRAIPFGRLLAMPETARCVECAGRA